jgi:hypothetical protein
VYHSCLPLRSMLQRVAALYAVHPQLAHWCRAPCQQCRLQRPYMCAHGDMLVRDGLATASVTVPAAIFVCFVCM